MAPRKTSTTTVRKPRVRKLVVKSGNVKVAEKPLKAVVFEKHKVLKVLTKGHIKTHFHCSMEGGFTQHVPKRLF